MRAGLRTTYALQGVTIHILLSQYIQYMYYVLRITHTSQLTAHSSQLTAHSSQLTVCVCPVMVMAMVKIES